MRSVQALVYIRVKANKSKKILLVLCHPEGLRLIKL